MPYKFETEKVKLPREFDRRVKLTDAQKEEIKELRRLGLTYQVIADRYNVSKRRVIQITNPEIAERDRLRFIQYSREGRYKPSKEDCRKIMREHRRYKYRVLSGKEL